MVILKCKMCGGDLHIEEGMTVCECEYCGSKQTVPTVDNEKKLNLFARANRLRSACEFDKAFGVYESIVSEFQDEAEAYWGLILCKYGIEYVDDPKTGKKIPTCHRSSFDSIMKDPDFDMVMECSDSTSRAVYREEAKTIEDIRVKIIDVSSKEEPYDIFICYKETAEDGQRTIDSVIAQDVYKALTEEGYRVFFSRISLEDKLGQEYEPYIFAALNSAKVMLAFGTDYEYYNAVWVKNEWSRFLSLIEKGEKKTLIPCYKDIDAYDMPEEFKRLQAQDMGKVGAIQDLVRGIEKIIGKEAEKTQQVVISNNPLQAEADALCKRAMYAMEDRDWSKAYELFESAVEKNPDGAEIYLGQALLAKKCSGLEELKRALLKNVNTPKYDEQMVYLVHKDELQEMLNKYYVPNYLSKIQIKDIFSVGKRLETAEAYYEDEIKNLKNYFERDRYFSRAYKLAKDDLRQQLELLKKSVISEYELRLNGEKKKIQDFFERENINNEELLEEAYSNVDRMYSDATVLREEEYKVALELLKKSKKSGDFRNVTKLLEKIDNYKDVDALMREAINMEYELRNKEKLRHKIMLVVVAAVAIVICVVSVFFVRPRLIYQVALKNEKDQNYVEAVKHYEKIIKFKDSQSRSEYCNKLIRYEEAEELVLTGKIKQAYLLYSDLGTFLDCKEKCSKLTDEYPSLQLIKGNVVTIGKYLQSIGEKAEKLEWIVVDKKDDAVLVVTRNIIESKSFGIENNQLWEDSEIKKWLNSEFVDEAFSESEKVSILQAKSYSEGIKDDELIFLLSEEECKNLSKKNLLVDTTKYVQDKYGVGDRISWWTRTLRGEDNSKKWRSSGKSLRLIANVGLSGEIGRTGEVDTTRLGIRPAMWIKIDGDFEVEAKQ